ncbi:MAG: glycosyltransferase family 2 protein [Actinomycetota bacterium]|nr:glycosyltransferase family 2 protein [Actinomycetota bacterium]
MSNDNGVSNSVGVVVVNFNGDGILEKCVNSLLLNSTVSEIVVVDNASTDSSLKNLRTSLLGATSDVGVEIIEANANLGYGRACNLGARRLNSEFVLISNPDIEYEIGSVDRLVEELKLHELGAIGPQIINADKSRYPSVRPFPSLFNAAMHSLLGEIWPSNPFSKRYKVDVAKSIFSDRWISGASILMPLDLYRQVGGFDHGYFMYMEDVDLCRRILELGYEIGYCEDSIAIHFQGFSSKQRPYFTAFAHHRSLWVYSNRTLKGSRRILLPAVMVGIIVRFSIRVSNILIRKFVH